MTNLSQENCNVIEQYPLEDSLDHLQGRFEKEEESYNAANNDSSKRLQKAVSELLISLISSEAASYLISRAGNRHILGHDLLELRRL